MKIHFLFESQISNFKSLPARHTQGNTRVPPQRASRGFTLIECLVYISVLGIILAIGSAAFYRCWDGNKAITRDSNDIVQTLKIGEAWRADMRAATGPIHITTHNSAQTIRIPHGKTEVIYSFANGEILKQTGADGARKLLLEKITTSQMQIDKRERVTACRWELELMPQRKHAKVRPLFTFLVVPGNSVVE